MRTGRPTKLTPALQQEVVTLLRAGNYIETACAFVDVDKASLYAWLKRGNRQKTGIYRDFLNATEKAIAEAEIRDLEVIRKDGAWQGAAWRLERKFPDKWGRRDRHELTGKDGGPIELTPFVIELHQGPPPSRPA
jgi:transposase